MGLDAFSIFAEWARVQDYCKQCQYPYHDGICSCGHAEDDEVKEIADRWYKANGCLESNMTFEELEELTEKEKETDSILLRTRDEFIRLSEFLKSVPNLTVLHSDSPLNGKRGLVAYFVEGEEENAIKIEYLEYKEPSVIHEVTDENIDIVLKDLTCKYKFYRCDLPKERKVVYIRRVDVSSSKDSYGYSFNLSILKKHANKVRDLIKKKSGTK